MSNLFQQYTLDGLEVLFPNFRIILDEFCRQLDLPAEDISPANWRELDTLLSDLRSTTYPMGSRIPDMLRFRLEYTVLDRKVRITMEEGWNPDTGRPDDMKPPFKVRFKYGFSLTETLSKAHKNRHLTFFLTGVSGVIRCPIESLDDDSYEYEDRADESAYRRLFETHIEGVVVPTPWMPSERISGRERRGSSWTTSMPPIWL